MTSKQSHKNTPQSDLRSKAVANIKGTQSNLSKLTAEEVERLVYELEIHQEELHIQNEELRQTQVLLEESRSMYSDLYEFAPVGYITIDQTDSIVRANLTAATMLGRERGKLIGARFGFFCKPSARTAFQQYLDNVRSDDESLTEEFPFATGSDDAAILRLTSNRVPTGKPDEWHCNIILLDVTQARTAQQVVLERDRHLRCMANSAPILIAYLNCSFRLQFVNSEFQEWVGHSSEQLLGQDIQNVLFPGQGDPITPSLLRVLTGHRIEFEIQLNHQRLGTRLVRLILVPETSISSSDVIGIHSLCIDISEQKVVEIQTTRRNRFETRLVRLNAEERQVYELILCGKSNKTIAIQLDIGLRTAERRRQAVLEKLEVESLADLLQQVADIQSLRPR